MNVFLSDLMRTPTNMVIFWVGIVSVLLVGICVALLVYIVALKKDNEELKQTLEQTKNESKFIQNYLTSMDSNIAKACMFLKDQNFSNHELLEKLLENINQE